MKKSTNFEAVNDEDVIGKTYLDEKFSIIYGHLSLWKKTRTTLKSLVANSL